MWMSAENVVRFGIESVMRDKPLITAVPGRVNRFIVLLIRFLPQRLTVWLTQRQSRRFRAQENAAHQE
jgi:hypothetical protein